MKEEQIIGTVSEYNPWVEKMQKILEDAHFDASPIAGVMGSQTERQ